MMLVVMDMVFVLVHSLGRLGRDNGPQFTVILDGGTLFQLVGHKVTP